MTKIKIKSAHHFMSVKAIKLKLQNHSSDIHNSAEIVARKLKYSRSFEEANRSL
jgi:hypothetical protein